MKRLPTILRIIALVGLVLTIVLYSAHWLNRHYTVLFLIFSSLLFTISGLIRMRINSAEANKLVKTPLKVKRINIVVYFFAIAAIIGMSVNMLGMRHTGKAIINYSALGLMVTCIVLLCSRQARSRISALYPAYSQFYMSLLTMIMLAPIGLLSSHLLKMNHYPGASLLRETCIAIIFVAVLPMLIFIAILRNRYQQKYQRSIPSTVTFGPNELDSYVGVYFNARLQMNITVMRNDTGTSLVIPQAGLNVLLLAPLGKDLFTNNRTYIIVEFKPKENRFTLMQHGRSFEFIKSDG